MRRLRSCVSFLVLIVAIAGLTGAGLLAVYGNILGTVPSPEIMAQYVPPSSTKLYDRNGKLLYEIFDPAGGRRTIVRLDQIPKSVIQATVATEDGDFFTNPGVSPKGLLRALWHNAEAGEVVEGGSGITQQLVKNVLIDPEERYEQSMERKVREAVLAFEITRRYPKETILEWYLNEIGYGDLAYGIESAAYTYFGKTANKLTLAESALLAGLPQSPSRYSPSIDPVAAKARQSDVLDLMVRHSFITQPEADAAKAEELTFLTPSYPLRAPHFVATVRDRLEIRYGRRLIEQGGFSVITTVDLDLQAKAEKAVADGVAKLANINAGNGSLVAIDPANGEVLAMVGSADYWDADIRGQVNMSTSPRQPGSSFKPITYLAAFMKGYNPATVLQDVAVAHPDGDKTWVPVNSDNKYRGAVTIRSALAQSLNPPAVKALEYAGLDHVLTFAHALGINDLRAKNRYGLSLTLGGGEVKLLDMTYVYSVFANGGVQAGSTPFRTEVGMRQIEPTMILSVKDPWGNEIEEHHKPRTLRIAPEAETYLLTDILADNNARAPVFGTNSPLKLTNRPAAVKTGTTNDYRDFWAIGYTPQLVAGVWVGNTNNREMKASYSSSTAAPIWKAFMESALAGKPALSFSTPDSVERAVPCSSSGVIPFSSTTNHLGEMFVKGKVPAGYCAVAPAVKAGTTPVAGSPTAGAATVTPVAPTATPATRSTAIPTSTPVVPTPTAPAATATRPASNAPLSAAIWPQTAMIGNTLTVRGEAAGDVARWALEVSTESSGWVVIGSGTGPESGTLGTWQPTVRGPATVRLTVTGVNGQTRRTSLDVDLGGI